MQSAPPVPVQAITGSPEDLALQDHERKSFVH